MHHHTPPSYGRIFVIAVLLNSAYVVLELWFSHLTQSHSLLADALHNIGDISGLLLAWLGYALMTRQGHARFTYGYKKLSIVASLINGLLLVASAIYIVLDAYGHLLNSQAFDSHTVLWVAAVGIVINGGTAMLFMRHHHDLNIKGAFLHLMADALVSAGVVLGAGLHVLTGWSWIDPIIGVAIALIIVWSTYGLLSESCALLLAAVPSHIEIAAVRQYLQSLSGVKYVHDLHIWSISTQEVALTAHLVMPDAPLTDEALQQVNQDLQKKFSIRHVTLQIEKNNTLIQCHQDQCC